MTWVAGNVLTAAQLNTYLPQAWTPYTPTLSGTGVTQGNSARSGAYLARGKAVDFWAKVTLGGTTVIGSSIVVSLPTAAAGTDRVVTLYGTFTDTGSNVYRAFPFLASTSTVQLSVIGTNGAATATSSTVPFTWAATDVIYVGGTYEVS